MSSPSTLALPVVLAVVSACAGGVVVTPRPASGERDGLRLEIRVSATEGSLLVESMVENGRPDPVHLVPDQCGRVTEVLLARTQLDPEGVDWDGSVGALKALVLRGQAFEQIPDRFHPRRPGDPSSQVPDCRRPSGAHELLPGARLEERWELPIDAARTLDAVGSEASRVRVEIVEARAPEAVEYLDFQSSGMADAERAGRALRLDVPAATLIQRSPRPDMDRPSRGELFDRLMEDAALREWVAAQPEDGWRQGELARLTPDWPGVQLRAVTTAYERALIVRAEPDGSAAASELPGRAERSRVFGRRPATTPPGVPILEGDLPFTLSEDVLPGSVTLPSGRLAVGGYLFDEERLPVEVAPGEYPVHATLAEHEDGGESVTLLTLVATDTPTVSWRLGYSFPVDGGTTTITSAEAADALDDLLRANERAWWEIHEATWDSLSAHDHHVTAMPVGDGLDLVMSSSGFGDGVYGVYVGSDTHGRTTRVVVDFGIVPFDWQAVAAGPP